MNETTVLFILNVMLHYSGYLSMGWIGWFAISFVDISPVQYTDIVHNPFLTKNYYALVDSSGALLTIGTNISAMVFLNSCTPDTYYASGIQDPNYTRNFKLFFVASIKPEDCPRWTWDYVTRKLVETEKNVLTESLFAKSRLAESKRGIISKILTDLNSARYKVMTGILFQETVYLTKKMQAQAFKDSGYDENLLMEYPYVAQYADFAHISLRQAAEDILLKAQFYDGTLQKTELLRLKYFNRVKAATESEELPSIFEDFFRESYLNAKI